VFIFCHGHLFRGKNVQLAAAFLTFAVARRGRHRDKTRQTCYALIINGLCFKVWFCGFVNEYNGCRYWSLKGRVGVPHSFFKEKPLPVETYDL
jgi:hypothetical protein